MLHSVRKKVAIIIIAMCICGMAAVAAIPAEGRGGLVASAQERAEQSDAVIAGAGSFAQAEGIEEADGASPAAAFVRAEMTTDMWVEPFASNFQFRTEVYSGEVALSHQKYKVEFGGREATYSEERGLYFFSTGRKNYLPEGSYELKVTLLDEGYTFYADGVPTDTYVTSYSIGKDRRHTVTFKGGREDVEGISVKGSGFLSGLSYGDSVTLPTDWELLRGSKNYVLIGWTTQKPASAAYAYSGENLSLLSSLSVLFPVREADGSPREEHYLIGRAYSYSKTDQTFSWEEEEWDSRSRDKLNADGTYETVLYAVWGIDVDKSGVPDWYEQFSLRLETGVTGEYALLPEEGFPQEEERLYSAGEQLKLLPAQIAAGSYYWLERTENEVPMRYVLYGWTTTAPASVSAFREGYFISDEGTLLDILRQTQFYTDEYMIQAKDAMEERIVLYAVWATDNTHDGTPELGRVRYTVSYLDGADIAVSKPYVGEHGDLVADRMPTPVTEMRSGEVFRTAGEKRYAFAGWTLTSDPEHLCASAEEYSRYEEELYFGEKVYRLLASDADEGGIISLYAVWVLDENANGGADWLDGDVELNFVSAVEGRISVFEQGQTEGSGSFSAFERGMAQSRVLAGKAVVLPGEQEGKYTVTLRQGESVYYLVGWTDLSDSRFLFMGDERPEELLPKGSFFPAGEKFTPSEEGNTLYAVWAADSDENGTVDYAERFFIVFTNNFGAEGRLEGSLPETIEANVGEEVVLGGEALHLFIGEEGYVLAGWTDLYDPLLWFPAAGLRELLERGRFFAPGSLYCVRFADDADRDRNLLFYPVWAPDRDNNGYADWGEALYTVTYENLAPMGEVEGWTGEKGEFRQSRTGLSEGESISLPSGARMKVEQTVYLLIGWTLANTDAEFYLFTPEKGNSPGQYYVGTFYVAGALYRVGGSVTFYAVWAPDSDEDGQPDCEERYRIGYADMAAGEKMPQDTSSYCAGEHVKTAGRQMTERQEGRYVLFGWSTVRIEQLYEQMPSFEEGCFFPAGEEFVFRAELANSANVLTLYAVWGIDANASEVPDFAETFTVLFESGGAEEVTLPKPQQLQLGASASERGLIRRAKAAGSNYAFLGWTLAKGVYLCGSVAEEPRPLTGNFSYTVRAEDADPEGNIRFYAVWAIDENENGTPDYYDVFAVHYVDSGDGALIGTLPETKWTGQGMAVARTMPSGLKKQVNGERYALIGWTTVKGGYLWNSSAWFQEKVYAGTNVYIVSAADADGDSIFLYAVWGLDSNKNGVPDYQEQLHWDVTFDYGGYTPPAEQRQPDESDLIEGKELFFRDGTFSMQAQGVNYLLVGWTAESRTSYLWMSEPDVLMFALGGGYVLDERGIGTTPEGNPYRRVIRFHAVWAADNEGGRGDGTADYTQRYTLTCSGEGAKEVMPDDLPYILRRLLPEEKVTTKSGYFATVEGKRVFLIGWSMEAGTHFVTSEAEKRAIKALIPAGGEFVLHSADTSSDEAGGYGVTLYAVWAEDQNANRIPDWEEQRVFVRFSPGVQGGIMGQLPEDRTLLPGLSLHLGEGELPSAFVQGVHYLLMGWTTAADADGYFCADAVDYERAAANFFPFGTQYTAEEDVVFYAVWASDNERGGGDGAADFTQRYLVQFCPSVALGARDALLPDDLTNCPSSMQRAGDAVPTRSGYKLNFAGEHYVLLGWTTADRENYLLKEALSFGEENFTAAGEGYTVTSKDVLAGTIRLFALWGIDADENGSADWLDEKYRLIYLSGLEEREGVENFPASEEQYSLGSLPLRLPGLSDGRWTVSMRADTHYLLIGWTAVPGDHLFSAEEQPFLSGGTLIDAGEEVTRALLSSGEEGMYHTILLYAVWAEDAESGEGDGVPDYGQLYTVQFRNDEAGQLFPDQNFNDVQGEGVTVGGQKAGQSVITHAGYRLTVGGSVHYVLAGWTRERHERYLFTSLPQDLIPAGEEYLLRTRDAGKNGVVLFHAVWGIDENNNGIFDGEEERYTLSYATGSEHSLPEEAALLTGTEVVLKGEGLFVLLERRYLLIGWSMQPEPIFSDGTPDVPFFAVGERYTVTRSVTLQGVWALDCEGGVGDGIPDYTQSYSILFCVKEGDGTADRLPLQQLARSMGEEVLLSGVSFLQGTDGKAYTLLGWTADPDGQTLFSDAVQPPYPVGGSYPVDPFHAKEGIITLVAVWGEDENRNGIPDCSETFRLLFLAGTVGTAADAAGKNQLPYEDRRTLSSETFALPEGYRLTLPNGARYLLLGWKMQGQQGILCESKEEETAAGELLLRYALDPADADEESVITFYAVWGRDDNCDATADYLQTFNVRFRMGERAQAGVLKDPAYLNGKSFSDLPALERGTGIVLPSAYTLTLQEQSRTMRYVLMGWTRSRAESDYLCDGLKDYIEKAGKVILYGEGIDYAVLAADADSACDIIFYAVWGRDADGNGEADWGTYTVHFTDTVGTEEGYETSGPSWPLSRYGLAAETTDSGEAVTFQYEQSGIYFLRKKSSRGDVTASYTLAGWSALSGCTFGRGERQEFEIFARRYFYSAEGGTYCLPLTLADGYNRISLYAVWVEDNNLNGTFDWEEAGHTLRLADEETDREVTEDSFGNPLLAGMAAALPIIGGSRIRAGVRYLFLGWTRGESALYINTLSEFRALELFTEWYEVGQEEEEITLLCAVWASDSDENGKGNGVFDFREEYSIRFESAEGEVTPLGLPLEQSHLRQGELFDLPTGYRLKGQDGRQYMLVGFTLTPGEYLQRPEGIKVLERQYTVFSGDAFEGRVTLYAVWEEDENGNNIPDEGEGRVTVTFVTNASGQTVRSMTLLSGTPIDLPKLNVFMAEESSYLHVGWTAEVWESGLYFLKYPPQKSFLTAGGRYLVTEDVTFYGVWAADEDDDGTPDYEERFTVCFETEEEGECTLPSPYKNLVVGDSLSLPAELFLHRRGKRYVLVGWALNGDRFLWDSDPSLFETFYAAGRSYTLRAKDAAENVVRFKAVWAEDLNENGIADYTEMLYTLTYFSNIPGLSFPAERVLGGSEVLLAGAGSKAVVGKVTYLLLGWTKQPGGSFTPEEAGLLYTAAGERYTVREDTTLYAVWAADGDEDGIPDFCQRYTVRFVQGAEGELSPAPFEAVEEVRVQSGVALPSGATLLREERGAEAHYVLVGWTLTSGEHLGREGLTLVPAGGTYVLSSVDAQALVVTFYAVWVRDDNLNGIPDDAEQRFTVEFVTQTEISFPEAEALLRGTRIILPGREEDRYAFSVLHNGVRYLLVGWTEEGCLFGTPPAQFLAAGEQYAVQQNAVLYAVWAPDEDDAGKGNGTPDYLDLYTIRLNRPTQGELSPDDLPYLLRRQSAGTEFPLHGGYVLTAEGKNYVLLGWSKRAGEHLLRYAPGEELGLMTQTYLIDPRDAAEGIIDLYPVWAEDENGNGTEDFAEAHYTLLVGAQREGERGGPFGRRWEGLLGGEEVLLEELLLPACSRILDGKNFLLVGFTVEGGLAPGDLPQERYRERYVLSPYDDAKDGKEDLIITLYAVWSADLNCNEIPDSEELFTLVFSNEEEGELVGSLPEPVTQLRQGEAVTLTFSCVLLRQGRQYCLLGWDRAGSSIAATLPLSETFIPSGEQLVAFGGDADGEGKISYYAVWAEDGNANGRADFSERFTVHFSEGTEQGEVLGEFPQNVEISGELLVKGGVLLPLVGHLRLMANGKGYALFGWSKTRGAALYDAPPAQAQRSGMLLSGESYRVAAEDADGEGVIVLYALWGSDRDNAEEGDFVPDWMDSERYTVQFLLSETGGTLLCGEQQFTPEEFAERIQCSGLRSGDVISFPDMRSVRLSVEQEGKRVNYLFSGWKMGGCVLVGRMEEYLAVTFFSGERVEPRLAVLHTVTLCAVWAVDRNEDGTADFTSDFFIRFHNTAGGTLSSSLPADIAVENGALLDLGAYSLSLTVGGHSYTLIGWTSNPLAESLISSQEQLRDVCGENILYGAERSYFVDYAAADSEGGLHLYALWGADGNRSFLPDWEERFTLRYNGITGARMPEEVRDLSVGEKITLPAGLTYRSEEGSFALLGWRLYGKEAPMREYLLSADDAEGTVITLYAVWAADENSNGVPDEEDNVLFFLDGYGFAPAMPNDLPYRAGEEVVLPEIAADAQYCARFLGWTDDPALPGTLLLSAQKFAGSYLPAGGGLKKLYAVWGAVCEVENFTYGEVPKVSAPASNVQEGRLLLSGGGHEIYITSSENLNASLVEALTGLGAGDWRITVGEELLAAFTVSPREITLSGVAVREKFFDGTPDAALDFSGARLEGLLPGDEVGFDSSSAAGIFRSAEAGEWQVDISGVSLTGGDAANYLLTLSPASGRIAETPPDITPLVLLIGVQAALLALAVCTVALRRRRPSGKRSGAEKISAR